MGIRCFFQWFVTKYPCILKDCIDEKIQEDVDLDLVTKNPNGCEFDSLFIDINGICHPNCRFINKQFALNEDEMIKAMFLYIDHIFSIVQPRKLIYLAIDGVAPRAKINQQRSQRFKNSQEMEKYLMLREKFKNEWIEQHGDTPLEDPDLWDCNAISSGTLFMEKLSQEIQYYIQHRIHTSLAWKKIKVIFSDEKSPGEGAQKILKFIRVQRATIGYNPNTTSCLYGMDSDLIMLSLSVHDPRFYIIREKINLDDPKRCSFCSYEGHDTWDCKGLIHMDEDDKDAKENKVEFQFLVMSILREYLTQDLSIPDLQFPYNFERILDDFVFLCFFTHNDFLPHLPSLNISEGAVDILIEIYKKRLPELGGYLMDNSGTIDLIRFAVILTDLGEMENWIFLNREKCRSITPTLERRKKLAYIVRKETITKCRKENISLKNDFNLKLKLLVFLSSMVREKKDEIKFGMPGYKVRYYKAKMRLDIKDTNDNEALMEVLLAYIEGLQWVMYYYYRGCPSWTWFYQFHYAPFASCLMNISQCEIKFQIGKPFSPIAQLMSTLPTCSSHYLPPQYAKLMTDFKSPILDFYPKSFELDLNGEKYNWQGIALLPMIDEKRLLHALKIHEDSSTSESRNRDSIISDYVFVHSDHPMAEQIMQLHDKVTQKKKAIRLLNSLLGNSTPINSDTKNGIEKKQREISIDPITSDNLFGSVKRYRGSVIPGTLCCTDLPGLQDIPDLQCISSIFLLPPILRLRSKLLLGVIIPPKTLLKKSDFAPSQNHKQPKAARYYRNQSKQCKSQKNKIQQEDQNKQNEDRNGQKHQKKYQMQQNREKGNHVIRSGALNFLGSLTSEDSLLKPLAIMQSQQDKNKSISTQAGKEEPKEMEISFSSEDIEREKMESSVPMIVTKEESCSTTGRTMPNITISIPEHEKKSETIYEDDIGIKMIDKKNKNEAKNRNKGKSRRR